MPSSYYLTPSPSQQRVLDVDMGFDDGGRYVLIAVSGYEIQSEGHDFGTVFCIIDTDTGQEMERSEPIGTRLVRTERVRMMGQVMHLNGKQNGYAA